MSDKDHACCSHGDGAESGVAQSMTELEFERGIWQAALDGDSARVSSLLSRRPDSCRDRDASGFTAFHYAARAGHQEVVRLLLSAGADPNAATPGGGVTPLHRAAYKGRAKCLQLIIASGGDPFLADSDGATALHKAGEGGSAECYKIIVDGLNTEEDRGRLESARDARGRTAEELLRERSKR